MKYSFPELTDDIKETKEWLKQEFSSVRTGRATAALFDSVKVESYGSYVPIGQLASLTLEDARTVRIKPYDQSAITNIEKAISKANLGVSVSVDDQGLRVIFPELTKETREKTLKRAKEKYEEARVHLRQARDEEWKRVQEMHKNDEISEDEMFRIKGLMEDKVKAAQEALAEMYEKKSTDIMS